MIIIIGLTNPIWGIAKTLVSEVCSAKHEAKGMGLTTGCWSLGLVVGPAYGGMLANPTQLYPHIFGGTIFDTYPYLLPNAITAAFGLIGCIFLIIFFPETLPQSTANHTILPSSPTISTQSLSSNSTTTTTTTTTTSSSSETRGASIIELCSLPGVIPVLFAYLAISFSSICFDEIIPLWSMATHPHGGLELQQVLIGTMLTITGVVLTIYTFVVYPVIAQNLGRNRSFQYSQIFLALLVPCTTFLHKLSPSSRARFPLLILMYTLSKASCSLGFASIALILNHCVSKDKRGSLNGLSMTFGSIAKSIGPLFAAVVFAWSIQVKRIPPLDYHLVFLIISCSSILSLFIPLPSEHSQSHSQSESQTIIQQQQNQKEQNQEEGEDNNESIEMIEVRKNQRENNKEKNITSSITDFIGGFIYGQKGYQSLTTEEADEMDEEQHK